MTLLFSMTPYSVEIVEAEATIQLTVTPSTQTVDPGESAEYIVRVYNQGAEAITAQLSAANGGDCTGYSTQIGQITGLIDAGDYGETTMNVTLAQNAEGACDTTVTATANEQASPPPPTTADQVVTTTAGDGSGSVLFGVEITVSNPSKTWDGTSEEVLWDAEVENTGQSQANISLTIEDSQEVGCGNAVDLGVSVVPDSLQLDSNETEWVEITVVVPEGQEADEYCWEITATVQNGGVGDDNSDTEPFSLDVPEIHTCEVSLDKTTIYANPEQSISVVATFSNTGNSDWDIKVDIEGSRDSWADVSGASTGVLPYDDGSGTKEFTIVITPDDSIEANSETILTIKGKEAANTRCSETLRVTVGQSFNAGLSLDSTYLPNVDPGSNASTLIKVTNQGNGPDTFRITASLPPTGWSISLSDSTLSMDSRHNSGSGEVEIQISLPNEALATDEVVITITVMPHSGGTAYASQDLTITVAAFHSMEVAAELQIQEGRMNTSVDFPFEVSNTGNIDDVFRFSVVKHEAASKWDYHFEDEDGNILSSSVSEKTIAARSTETITLVVQIGGNVHWDRDVLSVRITNRGDPDTADPDGDGIYNNQVEYNFTAYLSNINYGMDIRIEEGASDGRNSIGQLPPGGSVNYTIWVRNVGDRTADVIFDLSGLEGVATRTLYYQGELVTDEIEVPKGYGIWNINQSRFVLDENGDPYFDSDEDDLMGLMIDNGLIAGYESRLFELQLLLVITVSEGSENGDSGILEIVASAAKSSSNRSGRVQISITVQTVQSLDLALNGESSRAINFGGLGSKSTFEISLENTGNVASEIRVFTSEGLRGWSVTLSGDSACDSQENGELICLIAEGESATVKATVRPPHEASVADEFSFTFSAEPVDTGLVSRKNLELTVAGEPADNIFGSISDERSLAVIGGIVLIGLLFLLRRKP
jgi:uncharacterized membrane protein